MTKRSRPYRENFISDFHPDFPKALGSNESASIAERLLPESNKDQFEMTDKEREGFEKLTRLQTEIVSANYSNEFRMREFFADIDDAVLELERAGRVQNMYMIQCVFRERLARDGWKLCYEGPYYSGVFSHANYLPVETGPDKTEFAICDGLWLFELPNGKRWGVQWDQRYETPHQLVANLMIPKKDYDDATTFWKELDEEAKEKDFLRGQKIDGHGNFLKEIGEGNAWEELVLPQTLRDEIELHTLELIKDAERYARYGVPLKRGILLHGPPGTGKTMIGRALAQQAGCTFIYVTASQVHESSYVRGIYALARRLSPTIVFFEDLDLYAASRHSSGNTEVLAELLAGLDGLESSEGVITIATTNDIGVIEPALKDRPNRFDLVLEVPPFDAELRMLFLGKWVERNNVRINNVEEVAKSWKTDMTGAQMQELCRSAIIEALARNPNLGRKEGEELVLTAEHFGGALNRIKSRSQRRVGFV